MARVIVIGGGAAGFFGAITCAEHGGGDLLILEKGAAVLGKVKISGGGRCNVTHACFEPGDLVDHYPRGRKSLLGPFHRWQPAETVQWFERQGIALKAEPDGRMFPVTDDSQTIIDCLTGAARNLGVRWRTRCGVAAVRRRDGGGFLVETQKGETLTADRLLIATGGIRSGSARKPVDDLGHEVEEPVPSLFTFPVEDDRLEGLQGVSVKSALARAGSHWSQGPILITHWGVSGPAVLKLSALGARELAARNYRFEIVIDWTDGAGEEALSSLCAELRQHHGARKVVARAMIDTIPRRLWERLCLSAGLPGELTWSQLTRDQERRLLGVLQDCRFQVKGKSLNKEEFVTCGGVRLQDVNLKTMESKLVPGLYFAGEVLDIDGVTGGFNFQSAWTTGRIAGEAIAGISS